MKKAIEKKQRIDWIDWLRGLAIIFVVIGHFPVNDKVKIYLYSFHLPLFFILSGLTFNVKKYNDMKSFIKHKAKGILLPYLCLNLSYFAIWVLLSKILTHSSTSLLTIGKGILFANNDKVFLLNGPTWFLPTLFLVEVLGYLAIKYFKDDEKQLTILSFVFLLIGYAESLKKPKELMIWHMNSVPVAFFLFIIGYVFYKYYTNNKEVRNKIDNFKSYFGILFLLLGFYFAIKNGKVSFGGNSYKSITYTLISIFFSCTGYFLLIRKVCQLQVIGKVLSYIGKNTLFILGFHKVLLFVLKYLDFKYINHEWWAIALALVSVLLTTLVSLFINKVCPFVVGKMEKTKRNYISFAIYLVICAVLVFKYCI